MRRGRRSDGFFLCFIINFAFTFRWAFLIAILLVMHFVFAWPWWLFFIPLFFWIMHALIVTVVIFLGNKAGNMTVEQKEDINPYSPKNSDYLKKR